MINPLYRMTPKAYLAFKLRVFSFKRSNRVWDDLTDFVRKQAIMNGLEDGIPCLIFDKGGHCITVAELAKKSIDPAVMDSDEKKLL